mgnify:CR=1 FL=1
MNRVAIYGCGAMGTVLGAFLAREGVDVDLVDVYREHVEKLNECGARLVGFEDFTQPVKALTPDQAQGVYDLVILFTSRPPTRRRSPRSTAWSMRTRRS